ncbi:unnamed protein product [Mycena citricolor]|uniref:WIF domain-containing protein n=1 Tax=Mycena citricolor TaxID=2018698 RepID=A0AAD2HYU5_9AGAR|nr:unnamed protein product [Mycena citricolor]
MLLVLFSCAGRRSLSYLYLVNEAISLISKREEFTRRRCSHRLICATTHGPVRLCLLRQSCPPSKAHIRHVPLRLRVAKIDQVAFE